MRGETVDFGRTASDYGRFRAGFPQAFFDALVSQGWVAPGQRALDLGTGTGSVARGLARLGLRVAGIDPAEELLRHAAALDREAGVEVAYRAGRAEALGEPDGSYDVVTAGQCWHWFDRPVAARETKRVLADGGRIVIAHFDWLPLPGNVVEATEALIVEANPRWSMGGGSGIYPAWLEDLAVAGFEDLRTFSFDWDQHYTHEAWRGRIRASAGVQATLDEEAVRRFDERLQDVLARRFPEHPLHVPHRVWAVSGRKPPS